MKLLLTLFVAALGFNSTADVVSALPAKDRLAQVAKAIGTQLGDGNISTGTTELWAGKMKTMKGLDKKNAEATVTAAFKEAFQDDRGEKVPADAKLTVSVHSFKEGDAKGSDAYKMAQAIMLSNAYGDADEVWQAQLRYVWAVLRAMPVSKETFVGSVKTKLHDDSSDEDRVIEYFILINKDGKAVQLFTIEGTM